MNDYRRIVYRRPDTVLIESAAAVQTTNEKVDDERGAELNIDKGATSAFKILHMDEFVERLLRGDRFCDVALPRILKRSQLVQDGDLQPYHEVSSLHLTPE